VTPGWAGAASCKWLAEITVLDKPAEGKFHEPRLPPAQHAVKPGEAVKPEDTHSVTALTVKSLIAAPSDGAKLRPHAYLIQGVAWAGEAGHHQSRNLTDAGATWNEAKLGRDQAKYAWRLWNYNWKPAKTATT